MKIEYIEFVNHKVLGNLYLDFRVDQSIASTIFLAGENGTGKTSILNAINKLANLGGATVQDGDGAIFGLRLNNEQRSLISESLGGQIPAGQTIDESIKLELVPDSPQNWSRYIFTLTVGGAERIVSAHILSEAVYKGSFRTLYSNVAINFTPKQIKSVTAKNVDESNSSAVTSQDTATQITQLLVDIQALDDADLSAWVRQNRGAPVPDDLLDKRIKRFRNAFTIMFPSKEYKEIRNHNGEKKVVFSLGENECFIEQLSSGEKQIVFRGGFFLQNSQMNSSVIGLLDEPEISLHPSWQLRIMDFYKSVLGLELGDDKCQLIVATHSPFILHNHSRSDDKIIVLTTGENYDVGVSDTPSFFGWTPEEAIDAAFNISVSADSELSLVLVEGETDERYITAAAEHLGVDISGYEIEWVGRINESGNAEFTGDRALNQTAVFLKANPNATNRTVLLLYDSDTNKQDYGGNKLFVRAMPLVEGRSIKIGIENLLNIPDQFDFDQFTDEHEKIDEYNISTTVRKLNKTKLCDHLVKNIDSYPDLYENFRALFEIIDQAFRS